MGKFRNWSYAQLSKRVEPGEVWKAHDCLEHVEGIGSDGTEYQIEFNVDWFDKSDAAVLVSGSLSAEPQKPLWGIIPVYTPDVTDTFVMNSDGRICGADESTVAQQDGSDD